MTNILLITAAFGSFSCFAPGKYEHKTQNLFCVSPLGGHDLFQIHESGFVSAFSADKRIVCRFEDGEELATQKLAKYHELRQEISDFQRAFDLKFSELFPSRLFPKANTVYLSNMQEATEILAECFGKYAEAYKEKIAIFYDFQNYQRNKFVNDSEKELVGYFAEIFEEAVPCLIDDLLEDHPLVFGLKQI